MSSREKNLTIIKDKNGVQRLETIYYPAIPKTNADIYVSPKAGETLQDLAWKYYGDCTQWFIIALANELLIGENIPDDIILRIPPRNII